MAPSSTLTTTLLLLSHFSYLVNGDTTSTGPTDLNVCMRACITSTCQIADTSCLCNAVSSDSTSLASILSCMKSTCSENLSSDPQLSLTKLKLACSNAGAALPTTALAAASTELLANNPHVEMRDLDLPGVTVDPGTVIGTDFTVEPGTVLAPSVTVDGTVVAPSVTVGPGSVLAPSATVIDGTVYAPSVTVEPGSVIVGGGSSTSTNTANNVKSTSSSTASASGTSETSSTSGALVGTQTFSGAWEVTMAVMAFAGLGSLIAVL